MALKTKLTITAVGRLRGSPRRLRRDVEFYRRSHPKCHGPREEFEKINL